MRAYIGTATNLLGTLGVTVLDATGAVIVARSTAAVTQPVSGSYEYQTPDHARNAAETIGYRWDEGSAAASTVTDWISPTGIVGSSPCTLTITSGTSAIAGATVSVSTDAAGANRTRERVTDSLGRATFMLTNGATYYAWIYHADYTGTNPTAFTAVKD